jgi:hypothetical protein
MNLTYKLLCDRSQPQNSMHYTIPFLWHSKKGKTIKTENGQWLARVSGSETQETILGQ